MGVAVDPAQAVQSCHWFLKHHAAPGDEGRISPHLHRDLLLWGVVLQQLPRLGTSFLSAALRDGALKHPVTGDRGPVLDRASPGRAVLVQDLHPVYQALDAVRGGQADEVGSGPDHQGLIPLLFLNDLQGLAPESHQIPAPGGGGGQGVGRLDDLVEAHAGEVPADCLPRLGQASHRDPEVGRNPLCNGLRGLVAEFVRRLIPLEEQPPVRAGDLHGVGQGIPLPGEDKAVKERLTAPVKLEPAARRAV